MNDAEKIYYHIGGQVVSSVIDDGNGGIELIMGDGTTLSIYATRDAELCFRVDNRELYDIKLVSEKNTIERNDQIVTERHEQSFEFIGLNIGMDRDTFTKHMTELRALVDAPEMDIEKVLEKVKQMQKPMNNE